jgi:hypothetical protein
MSRATVSSASTSVKREGIVGLVAVHVHGQAALLRALHEQLDAPDARLAAALVVRDAADHVHAEVERLIQQPLGVGEAQEAVLGEGHELHVDEAAQLLADLDQGARADE